MSAAPGGSPRAPVCRPSPAHTRSPFPRSAAARAAGFLAILVATLVLLAPGARAVPAAPMQPLGSGLTVILGSVSPPVARAGTAVTVSGTVRNTGTAPVYAASVQVQLGRQGLPLRPDVTSWAGGSGSTVSLMAAGRQALPPLLAPGSSAAFAVRVPPSALPSLPPFAALPMAVTTTTGAAAVTQTGAQDSAGVHTFLPWLGAPKRYVPVSVAFAVPVTLDPQPALFGGTAAARTAAWRSEVGPSSRLARLAAALRGRPVTWAIDPAVLGPAQGRFPKAATPHVQALAGGLATRLRRSSAGHPVWALPYADPDLAALAGTVTAATGLRDVRSLLKTASRLGAALHRGVRDDIAWPADGLLTPARERQLRSLYDDAPLTAAVVAAPPVGTALSTTRTAPQKSAGGLPLLAYDPALSAELVAATSSATSAAAPSGSFAPLSPTSSATPSLPATSSATGRAAGLQLFLADSMALLSELPGRARTVLVAAPRGYAPDTRASQAFWSALRSASWLIPTRTTDVLHEAVDAPAAAAVQPPGTAAGAVSPTGVLDPGASALSPSQLAAAAAARRGIEGVSSVLPDPTSFRSTWQDVGDQLLSSRWRGRQHAYQQLQSRARHAGDDVRHGISVRTSSVNFFADQGLLQVTVVNDLNEPVHDVRLRLTPASARLRIQAQPPPLQIGARSRNQVRVPVRAIAAGLVPVDARLTTANGTRLGPRAQMLVRVQPTGAWIYWVLGAVTALVLVAGIVRTVRRSRRAVPLSGSSERTAEPAEPLR